MIKSIALLGALALLGGGTYVTVNGVCGKPADGAAAKLVTADAPCADCCAVESEAKETAATPCPAEGEANSTASATPAAEAQ